MNKYTIHGLMTVSCQCVVEASNEQEARKIAEEATNQELCATCASNNGSSSWFVEDLDGIADILLVEKD